MSIIELETEDESDWEYEYDNTQTETFHITLDLSSHVPHDAHESRAPVNTTTPTPEPQSSAAVENNIRHTQDDPKRRLQLLDISTEKPLISWNKQLFTCSWATAVGTDLHFALDPQTTAVTRTYDANGESGERLTPRSITTPAAAPPYTLLPPATLRLVARPAKLTPLPNAAPIALSDSSSHSAFLTRLSALKSSLGETDTVPLQAPKLDFANITIPTPSLLFQQEEPKPKARAKPTRVPRRASQIGSSRKKDGPAYKDDATFEDILTPLSSTSNLKRRHRKTTTEKALILAAVEAGETVDRVGEPRQLMDEPKSMSQMMTGSRGRGRLGVRRRGRERGRRNRWGPGERGGGDVMDVDDVEGGASPFPVAPMPRGGGVGWGGSSLNRHAAAPRMLAPAPSATRDRAGSKQYQSLAAAASAGTSTNQAAPQATQSTQSTYMTTFQTQSAIAAPQSSQDMQTPSPASQATYMRTFPAQTTQNYPSPPPPPQVA
jgi:hypothetical protein